MEATYGRRETFGDANAPLQALHPRAMVFDYTDQMGMTGWTIAGFGVSLLSENPSLLARLGLELLDRRMSAGGRGH